MAAHLVDMVTIRQHYRAANGGHWFDPDTMRFFGCRLPSVAYRTEDGAAAFFVSSERDRSYSHPAWGGRRLYTVRRMEWANGEIETVGEFGQYASRSGADKAARRLAAE